MTAKTLQLLLVEDNPAHAELIRRAFLSYDRQVELTVARTLQEARATLATVNPIWQSSICCCPTVGASNCYRAMKAPRIIPAS